jgi:hypothetical protein
MRTRPNESKISLKLRLLLVGTPTRRARTFPRQVMTISSPWEARSTSSESFCLASKIPTVMASSRDHLDCLYRLGKSQAPLAIIGTVSEKKGGICV